MQSAKEKLLSGHEMLKTKIKTDIDDDENGFIRTDELSQNPLTGLFLVLSQNKWNTFPMSMKVLWIASIWIGSSVQWSTTWLLYLYLNSANAQSDESDNKSNESMQLFSAMMACLILFVYVLGEIRKAFLTLYHYWAFLEFSLLHYMILWMLILDVCLHSIVAFLSVLAIQDQDNISDQLGICLAFFFIMELDEWIYCTFIIDFDVLQSEDFVMKSRDLLAANDLKQFYHKKAVVGIVWGLCLFLLSLFVVAYFFIQQQ